MGALALPAGVRATASRRRSLHARSFERPRGGATARVRALGAAALDGAYVGAKALKDPCKLNGMQNTLANHMRVFVAGDVSVQSLIYAAQAERDDRETAKRVLMVVAGWDKSATSMSELRARVQDLI